MATPRKYEELIRPFVREFGSVLADLNPSQIDEITALIQSGDLAGARQRMSYIAASGRGAEYVPRGTKRYNPAGDTPGGELSVRVNTGRAKPAPKPVAPEGGKDAAKVAGDGFFRKALAPVSMDVPRREFLPGDFRPDDTAGDAIRKILGYGVVPGAAVGMAARQLAEGGGVPTLDSDQEPQQPAEDERRAAVRSSLEAKRERHLQEIMMERFRRDPGMASPRN